LASDAFLGTAGAAAAVAGALAAVAGGPFRLDTVVLDLEATLGLTEAEDVDAEELLFLVLDVFKCIGPVLEVLSLLAEAAAEGSILSADLALATMPVLMEPDFIVLLGFAEVSEDSEVSEVVATAAVAAFVVVDFDVVDFDVVDFDVDAFCVWTGLTSDTTTASALLLAATASISVRLTAAGMFPCDESRLEFRLELLDSFTTDFDDSLFKDELERSSWDISPPRFLCSRPVSRSKRRTMEATLRGWPFLLLTSSDETLRPIMGLFEAEGIFSIRSLGSLNCSFTMGLVVGLVSSSDIMGAALTPAADSFLADLAASLLVDVERDNPSELLAL